jgi:uncharacterized delta-60 repeat protein
MYSLDATYGSSGTGVVTVPLPYYQTIHAAALQPDGKILAAGITGYQNASTANVFIVVRFNTDGSLDNTFGSGGVVQMPTTFTTSKVQGKLVTSSFGFARDMALQPDGKIVLVGSKVVRLNANGSLDTSFGNGGMFSSPLVDSAENAVVLQTVSVGGTPETMILVGGGIQQTQQSSVDFLLFRLTPSGSFDTTFGSSGTGISYTDFCGKYDAAGSLAVDSAGRIIAAGYSIVSVPTEDYAVGSVARYSANGILDPSFGDASAGPGKSISMALAGGDSFSKVPLQADGKIVLLGNASSGLTVYPLYFSVVRLNADGTPDDTFGTAGGVAANIGSSTLIGLKGRIDGNGKIVMGGSINLNGPYDTAVARFLP